MQKCLELAGETKDAMIKAVTNCVKERYNHPVIIKTLEKLYDECMMMHC